jgi:arsenate reductase (glutaredoxin)
MPFGIRVGGPVRAPVDALEAAMREAAAAPPVQVFGRRDSRETQHALRFFKERRLKVSFVDIARKPPAPTELRRFTAVGGATGLFDATSRAYRDAGLAYLRMTEDEALERLLREPALLRLPLVRWGTRVTVGRAESDWKEWVAAGAGA